MIGIPYNLFGQLNIKVLLICPYDLNNYGGVQNQVKLLKKGLINKGIDTKILGPSSFDYDIGQALDIPFNGSKNPITFFPNKKLIKPGKKPVIFKLKKEFKRTSKTLIKNKKEPRYKKV